MDGKILTTDEAIAKLVAKSQSVQLPDGLKEKLEELFAQLNINSRSEESFWQNYQNASKYIDWVVSLPWFNSSQDILDLNFAKEKLNEGHYGLDSVKERILEYISVLALQKSRQPDEPMRAPIMLFVGLVGTEIRIEFSK